MTKLTGFLVAAGLAASLIGSPAPAQTSATGTMEMGLSMLELSAMRELSRIGVTGVDVATLSLGELSSIHLILANDGLNASEQRAQVQTVLDKRSRTIQ